MVTRLSDNTMVSNSNTRYRNTILTYDFPDLRASPYVRIAADNKKKNSITTRFTCIAIPSFHFLYAFFNISARSFSNRIAAPLQPGGYLQVSPVPPPTRSVVAIGCSSLVTWTLPLPGSSG